MMMKSRLKSGPILLDPKNFTPTQRTPWGGTFIGERIKSHVAKEAKGQIIGESWEFSCDPDFPSKLAQPEVDGPQTLLELIEKYPEECLSKKIALEAKNSRPIPACEILVKIVDAASPLSLQVHPQDSDAGLKPNECGKPESWLILHAKTGAGIYLGFSQKFDKPTLRNLLYGNQLNSSHLHFEPVKPGDYFEIGPGVPHAIGEGVTLLEPQRILTGRSGKTFRIWDWNRRYNTQGILDLEGSPRPLHIEESLSILEPEKQWGKSFALSLRRDATKMDLAHGVIISTYPANAYYRTYLIEMNRQTKLKLNIQDGYGAMISLQGKLKIHDIELLGGQPAFLPSIAMPMTISCEETAQWSLVVPNSTHLSFQ